MKNKGRGLRDVMKDICSGYGDASFTSYEIYASIMDMPKKKGRRRHYTLTYAEVKQILARADYVVKINEEVDEKGKPKISRYKNI